jgi:hypothetical protein
MAGGFRVLAGRDRRKRTGRAVIHHHRFGLVALSIGRSSLRRLGHQHARPSQKGDVAVEKPDMTSRSRRLTYGPQSRTALLRERIHDRDMLNLTQFTVPIWFCT